MAWYDLILDAADRALRRASDVLAGIAEDLEGLPEPEKRQTKERRRERRAERRSARGREIAREQRQAAREAAERREAAEKARRRAEKGKPSRPPRRKRRAPPPPPERQPRYRLIEGNDDVVRPEYERSRWPTERLLLAAYDQLRAAGLTPLMLAAVQWIDAGNRLPFVLYVGPS